MNYFIKIFFSLAFLLLFQLGISQNSNKPWVIGVGVDFINIQGGEMVLIEDGVFHRVHNTGKIDLYMVCIFDGERNH